MKKEEFSIKIVFLSIFLLVFGVIAHANEMMPGTAPVLYELLPGGTHFYDGNTRKGITFLATELSLFSAGMLLNNHLEKDTNHELNIPYILAGQIYTIDKSEYFRERFAEFLRENTYRSSRVQCDNSPLSKLMTAPFKSEVILSTFVITWAALGILDGVVSYPKNSKSYRDMNRVNMFAHDMSRSNGTAAYFTSACAVSLGAAVSEEMFFRGIALPAMDYRYGQMTGLITTSLVFGLLHLFNPGIDKPVYCLSQATAAGFAFGYHIQHNNYSLSKAIAAHFWYNIFSMTTTWLINPEENPLGISVRFAY